MPNDLPISSTVFALLCADAEAGRSIDLARAGLHATFEQARALAILMKGSGVLSLRNEGFDLCEMSELRLFGCTWLDGRSADRPKT
jgi:hypothetical protein